MPPPDPPPPAPAPLVEGVDYYLECGRWVFTAQYLRLRGYCCGSGCRHCPYREAGTTEADARDDDNSV